MGFQQGLSGLNTSSKNLAVIGNNVANATTVGFKSGRAEFADVYANATGGGTDVGIGARVSAVSTQFGQGNVSTTSSPLDIAIKGSGFFRMTQNGAATYSRNGQFSLDKDGYIVNSSGANLTGYGTDSRGNVLVSAPGPLQVSLVNVPPSATTAATMGVNLDSRVTPPAVPFSMVDSTSYNSSTAVSVYDSQGNPHTLATYFRKSAANTWDVYASVDGTMLKNGAGATVPVTSLAFDAAGTLPANANVPLAIPLAGGVATPLNVALSFPAADTTQFGVNFSVSKISQDGYTTGKMSGYTIGGDGVLLGRYDNGQSRALGQIVLSNFIAPEGLSPLGNNQFSETAASGAPMTSQPGSGVLGSLQSGSVEESNVDLTQELVNMITAQRIYQANAQTVRTEDQVMQTLVNMR